ncbi:MAG: hypothetical protein EXS05_00320 [Planctomycetaceae bacterium]|nr:hypothetical protein [Planctomycetaceae bacterium]
MKPMYGIVAVCVISGALVALLFIDEPRIRELRQKALQLDQDLRHENPLESLSERLAYERTDSKRPTPPDTSPRADGVDQKTPKPIGRPDPNSREVVLSSVVSERLEEFEHKVHPIAAERRAVLSYLHTGERERFIRSPGFGRTRARAQWRTPIELPATEAVPLPPRRDSDPPYDMRQLSAAARTDESPVPTSVAGGLPERVDRGRIPTADRLFALHDSGVDDFLDPLRLGYIQDLDHVAGFQPHRFTRMPTLVTGETLATVWQIDRLELLSLLKHAAPVVYVSQNLPQMYELNDAPTRPLDTFERVSLARLWADEDLVIAESPYQIRMLGSLRAAEACIECHAVRRGELLGALTYELGPERRWRQ